MKLEVKENVTTLIGEIPLVSKEYADSVNEFIKGEESKYKTTSEHTKAVVLEAVNQIRDLIERHGGGYMGDYIKVKIVLEYQEENK